MKLPMKSVLILSSVVAVLAWAWSDGFATLQAARRADVVRTVYFSAVDGSGAQVNDLTAADLAVKEGGKDRPITKVEPATEPLQVALLVDDAGTGAFQAAVAQFLQATLGHGKVGVSVLSPQPMKVADYTDNVDLLKTAIGTLGQRGRIAVDGEQIIEAVGGAAKELRQRKATRGAIVVLTVSGEKALSDLADPALNELKSSGASLNVLHITGIALGKVLGDGPKQSGGMIQQASGNVPLGPVLAKIADHLLHQYALTYTIPDGTKLNEKLALTTTRRGVTLLAPSRLPDK